MSSSAERLTMVTCGNPLPVSNKASRMLEGVSLKLLRMAVNQIGFSCRSKPHVSFRPRVHQNMVAVPQAYLRLCNDEGAQVVVANGTRHGQDTHHTLSIPPHDLTASRLDSRLRFVARLFVSAMCWDEQPAIRSVGPV